MDEQIPVHAGWPTEDDGYYGGGPEAVVRRHLISLQTPDGGSVEDVNRIVGSLFSALKEEGVTGANSAVKLWGTLRNDSIGVYEYENTPRNGIIEALKQFDLATPDGAKRAVLAVCAIEGLSINIGRAPESHTYGAILERLHPSPGVYGGLSNTQMFDAALTYAWRIAVYQSVKESGASIQPTQISGNDIAPVFRQLLRCFCIDPVRYEDVRTK